MKISFKPTGFNSSKYEWLFRLFFWTFIADLVALNKVELLIKEKINSEKNQISKTHQHIQSKSVVKDKNKIKITLSEKEECLSFLKSVMFNIAIGKIHKNTIRASVKKRLSIHPTTMFRNTRVPSDLLCHQSICGAPIISF